MTIRPEHQKTFPNARIAETVLMFLRLRGGEHAAMSAAAVYAPLADYYELSEEARALSRDAYYANNKKSGSAWESEVQEAVKNLKGDGYLVSAVRSGDLTWRLTEDGIVRADFWVCRMTEKTRALKELSLASQAA